MQNTSYMLAFEYLVCMIEFINKNKG